MRGQHAAALGAAVNGHEFADLVAVADVRAGTLAVIFQILRRDAHRRVGKENIVLADRERPFHDHMGF